MVAEIDHVRNGERVVGSYDIGGNGLSAGDMIALRYQQLAGMTIQGGDIAAMVDDEVPSIAYALDIGLLGLDDNAPSRICFAVLVMR